MFRCEECGSGYSTRAASSWEACPRCLARDKVTVPLTFELGWRGGGRGERSLPLKRIPLDGGGLEEPTAAEGGPAA